MTYDIDIRLEWDSEKNRANREKHGLDFEEASILLTSRAPSLDALDEEHSDAEERYLSIGPISRGIIVIVWTEPEEDVLRLISARFADRDETDNFRRYLEAYYG